MIEGEFWRNEMSKMKNVLFFVQLERRVNKRGFNIQHNLLSGRKYEDYFGDINHKDYKMLNQIADNTSLFSVVNGRIISLLKS